MRPVRPDPLDPEAEKQVRRVQAAKELLQAWQVNTHLYFRHHESQVAGLERKARAAAWVAAFLAAVGALAIIANEPYVSAAFSATAAAASTYTAIYKPAERAAEHAKASLAYDGLTKRCGRLLHQVELAADTVFVERTAYDASAGEHYDAGYYRVVGYGELEAGTLETSVREIEDDTEKVKQAAPHVPRQALDRTYEEWTAQDRERHT